MARAILGYTPSRYQPVKPFVASFPDYDSSCATDEGFNGGVYSL